MAGNKWNLKSLDLTVVPVRPRPGAPQSNKAYRCGKPFCLPVAANGAAVLRLFRATLPRHPRRRPRRCRRLVQPDAAAKRVFQHRRLRALAGGHRPAIARGAGRLQLCHAVRQVGHLPVHRGTANAAQALRICRVKAQYHTRPAHKGVVRVFVLHLRPPAARRTTPPQCGCRTQRRSRIRRLSAW